MRRGVTKVLSSGRLTLAPAGTSVYGGSIAALMSVISATIPLRAWLLRPGPLGKAQLTGRQRLHTRLPAAWPRLIARSLNCQRASVLGMVSLKARKATSTPADGPAGDIARREQCAGTDLRVRLGVQRGVRPRSPPVDQLPDHAADKDRRRTLKAAGRRRPRTAARERRDSSSTTAIDTPRSTSVQGSLRVRIPSVIKAISSVLRRRCTCGTSVPCRRG